MSDCKTEETIAIGMEFEPVPGEPSQGMLFWADRLLAVRTEIDDLELEHKRLQNEFNNAQATLFDMMAGQEVDGFKFKGWNFRPTVKTRASIAAEHKERAIAWLKSSEYADLVKEQVNAQTLTSLVKEWQENGISEHVDHFMQMLKLYDDQKISITRGR